jgi:hypothetical protein
VRSRSAILVALFAATLALAGCHSVAPKSDPYAAQIRALQLQIEGLSDVGRTAGVTPGSSADVTSSVSDVRVRALEDQREILKEALLTPEVAHVQTEPTKDVSAGTFLARIQSVSSDTATTATVDFITNAAVPSATKVDLERSSWSDWIGWNKTRHPQTLRIGPQATLVLGDENGFRLDVVTPRQFARDWDKLDSSQKYYVHVRPAADGAIEISQVRPWIR